MRSESIRKNMPWPKRRTAQALWAAVVLLVVSIPLLVPPEDIPIPGCAFHAMTGLSCPTCGMTRSLHALSLGEWKESLRYHLMGPPVAAGTLLCCVVLSLEAITGKRTALRPKGVGKKNGMVLFAVAWLVYWIVRLITEIIA